MPQFLLSIDLDVSLAGPDADNVTPKVVGDIVAHEVAKALRLVEVRRATKVVLAATIAGGPERTPPAAVIQCREVAVLRAVDGALPPRDPEPAEPAPAETPYPPLRVVS